MRNVLIIFCFFVLSSFSSSSALKIDDGNDVIANDELLVQYCISVGGDLYRCAAATLKEARECAIASVPID